MSYQYQLSCESTVDLPYDYVAGREISVIFYYYTLDGVEHEDIMGRDEAAMKEFYRALDEGQTANTSQINTYRYEQYFEGLLQKGDVLHIALGSGMSRSVLNACEAADNLRARYPDRRIEVLDSLASSGGYGLLVDTAADLRDAGASFDEIIAFVTQNRLKLNHQVFSTDLTQYKRGGRVSGPYATIGNALGICVLLRLNAEGKLVAYDIARGKKKAIRKTADAVITRIRDISAIPDCDRKLFLANSDAPELSEELRKALIPSLGSLAASAPVYEIGTIIACHTGRGTACAYFFGEERQD